MSLERPFFGGPITFACDECGEVDETRCREFDGALAKVKSHGWVARKEGEEWLHLCGGCK